MKHRATRPLAMMLSAMLALVAAVPARAGTVSFAEVARLSAEGRRSATPDLHLRSAHQQGAQQATASGLAVQQKGGAASTTNPQQPSGTTADATTATNPDPLAIAQDPGTTQQGGTVETVDLGDVTGTVCDCGEIPFETPRGGIPWWPLVGIPIICVTGICTPENPPPPTPPTPPPPPVPEPATLMLFGSGLLALGAGARRRRARKTMEVEARDAEVV